MCRGGYAYKADGAEKREEPGAEVQYDLRYDMNEHTAVKGLVVETRELEEMLERAAQKGRVPEIVRAVDGYAHKKRQPGKSQKRRRSLHILTSKTD